MRTYVVGPADRVLQLGVQLENEALQIRFPIADWLRSYGSGGRFELLARRQGEDDAYTVQGVTSDARYVYWDVSNVDTGIVGEDGEAILHYYVDEVLAKSRVWWTEVKKSLGDPGDIPEPYRPQIDIVLDAAKSAKEDADRAEEAAGRAEEAAGEAESVADRVLPAGGTAGQYLRKSGDGDGETEWADLPVYDGAFEVVPKDGYETALMTREKYLDRDVLVKAVPYDETMNAAGGYTVLIG